MMFFSMMGSPPRMRGKAEQRQDHRVPEGITPAYAGKSRKGSASCGTMRDHPRVCGEKRQRTTPHTPQMGSPPRMRGKVNKDNAKTGFSGITPAYAGKRWSGSPG